MKRKILTGGMTYRDYWDSPATPSGVRSFSAYKRWTMRVTATCFLLTTMMVYGFAGSVMAQRITISKTDATLTEVIRELRRQSDYAFLFDKELSRKAGPVSIEATDASLRDVLEEIMADQPLAFTINDEIKSVVIKERRTPPSLARVLAYPTVTGRVTDSLGQPLSGASIRVRNADGQRTTLQTQTDSHGEFTLRNVPDDARLEVSYVGYVGVEIPAAANIGTIVLRQLPSALEEVEVNAGYYTTSRELATGNISRVTAEEIEKQPVSNPLQAIQGRMPGIYVEQNTGVPGGGFDIQIRGQNSLRTDGNDPLYIINGVPFPSSSLASGIGGQIVSEPSPLNAINPGDIQSIEILKDADATAIYGSRGANGVVLITTKRGNTGKTTLDINAYQGVGQVSYMMALLSREQYLEMRNEAFANDEATPQPWDFDMTSWDTTRYTDWQEELIGGTANQTNINASVSGGNVNTQFLIRGGYYRETTVFPGDFAYRKGSGHFNFSHRSDDRKFQADISLTYVMENNNLLDRDLTSTALTLPPVAPAIYDSLGQLNWENSTWDNPFSRLKRKYESITNNLIANGVLSYHVTSRLQVKANLGYTSMHIREVNAIPLSSYNPAFGRTSTSSNFGNGHINTWIAEPQLEYQRSIWKGKLGILIGSTFQQNVLEKQRMNASGFTSDAMLENPQAATSYSVFLENSQYRYNALFGRLNYNWEDKYLINLTGRRDGSSRFGPGKRFGSFGAVGVAWIFSNEEFIKQDASFLSFGKIRSSYGTSGNDQIPDYGYLDTYSSTQYPYNDVAGIIPVRLVNPDFAWEVNKKLEAALEAGFFNNRIFLTASWYRNRSSNQLVGYALPVITGQPSIQYNLPATVQNTGWEFELNTTNLKAKALSWTTAINLTIPRNKLVEYPNLEGSPYANTYVVGEPLNIAKAYQYNGVAPETGVYVFEDVNDDGSISSPIDRQTVKVVGPDFFGGIQNSIQFKNWQLDFFFQFVKQTGRNYLNNSFFLWPGAMTNQPAWVMERWQQAGDDTSIQRFSATYGTEASLGYFNYIPYSEKVVSNASFIRLKNVSLSYTIPFDNQNIRFYIQGQNLWTITNYQGMDPETGPVSLPPLRMITAGFQLTL